MVLDRRILEIAATSGWLGLLADDVLVALVHQFAKQPLSDRDRQALSNALDVLSASTVLSRHEVVTGPVLRSMAPLATIDETAGALTSAVAGDRSSEIQKHIETLRALLAGAADESALLDLRNYFERLADQTLQRSQSTTSPRDETREWIRTASTS